MRYATVEDYDAVMAINENILDGADYLPAVFNDFINDPMTRCYVLEINNIVVCWCIIFIGFGTNLFIDLNMQNDVYIHIYISARVTLCLGNSLQLRIV